MADQVTATGLTIKTTEQILSELEADQKADVDPAIITAAEEPIGQLNGIFASQLREGWEVLRVAYDAYDPDAAEDDRLDATSAITGTLRRKATKSTVTCTCNLDSGTTLDAGIDAAHVDGQPAIRFLVKTSFTAPSTGNHSVEFESENTGPIVANAGTLTVIATPKTGWNSVTNSLDATLGRVVDNNATLRTRREEELRATGAGTAAAVRADVLALTDVETVTVLENDTDFVDGNGLPPHSLEVVLFDSPTVADDVIAQTIFDTKPGGIEMVGTSSGNAIDSSGNTKVIKFTRPTDRDIFIDFDVDVIAAKYVGDTAVKDAVVARALIEQESGNDVILNLYDSIVQLLNGVVDVTDVRADFSSSPTSSVNLSIGIRERAVFDTSRITVTNTPV